jgi:hypothetical protein
MNDDELVQRFRDALDEVAAAPLGSPPDTSAADIRHSRRTQRGWVLAAAASVVVLVAGAAWAGSGHRARSTAPGDGASATTDVTTDSIATPGTRPRYEGTAPIIIDSGKGPMLAWSLEESLPPQGGDIPLAGFDWSMIEGEQTVGHTTWVEGTAFRVVGTWDGTTFTLTQPPAPVTSRGALGSLSHGVVTPNCTTSKFDALGSEVNANFRALHPTLIFHDTWDGRCRLYVGVAIETEASDAFAGQHAPDVYIDAALRPTDDPRFAARLVAPTVDVDVRGVDGLDAGKLLDIASLPSDRVLRAGQPVPVYTRDDGTSDALAQLKPGDPVDWVWADGRTQHLTVSEVVKYDVPMPTDTAILLEIHPTVGPALHVWLELQP